VLDAIEADGLPSPTDFSMSVHHALLGVLSIHTANHLGHTALSAGTESFGHGLIEAAACLAERSDEPVILIYADEKLPAPYSAFAGDDDAELPVVLALAIGAPRMRGGADLALDLQNCPTDAPPSMNMAGDFLRFFLSGDPVGQSTGRRNQWIWRRVCPT
jgi:hypothetical protein